MILNKYIIKIDLTMNLMIFIYAIIICIFSIILIKVKKV
jgi:hypothetical protein